MTDTTQYAAFLKARASAGRAIGRHIVQEIEAGNVSKVDPENITGLVSQDYRVKGLDTDVTGVIWASGYSRARRRAAIAAVRAAGFLPLSAGL